MTDLVEAIPLDVWIIIAAFCVSLAVIISACVCFVMWLWGHLR